MIMFPSDYFDPKKPDEAYLREYEAVCRISGEVLLFDYDGFVRGEKIKLYPNNYYKGECIYRGWMLSHRQYRDLYVYLEKSGIRLINTPEQYNYCHMFPLVYPKIKEFTPKILYYREGLPIDWNEVKFPRFMVKDYVKSVKGHDFPMFFETPAEPEAMNRRIAEFKELRGSLYTGGIVLKEFVDLKKYGGATNEYRAFYLNGERLSLAKNSNQAENCPLPPHEFADSFIKIGKHYFTVDFAELPDGNWIVLETGDGQVSGLSPGQWEFKYYDDMKNICEG